MTTLSSTRRSMLLIGIPALIVLGGLVWYISHHHSDSSTPPDSQAAPVVATTAPVTQQDVPIYLTGVGTVVPRESVTVRTRIDGELDQVGFTEGQDVVKGQLIAQLDPRTQQAQLDQALAQKAKDQAQLVNAKLDLRRYTELIKQDAATRQTLDTQRAQVAQIEAAVQSDNAQISFARTQLSYTHITAPISGRTGARLVDPGNIVHAADANGLVVINQIDPIAVVFTLPEESFQDINHALKASQEPLAVEAYPRNSAQVLGRGHLILLNNQIDTSTGTVQIKGSFPNPEHKLWPGQYVNARLYLGIRKQALTVPAEVVQRGPDGTYAYVVDSDETVRIQAIHVINIQDGIAIVDQGLSAGQRVVRDGQYKLRPGLRISEAQAQTAPAAKGNAK
ncbi:efflux RND transporter periplasmic adaptor subunit [Paralcaligenes sp. KSB-10]|uniref:efflux RND transporter periplasmic adaptor subunit n=1 Tax=Paralcaligenes sp. KSB-10 TaxID=2901142 RepID=UPI001E65823D|nr:efflux RND transporter periplasmic adaptor subunit [Paralcaligenes sp. KSB-10]UHL65421.1 efflux RND transporter periplasmic adaptor subunit [Paralcaligenes sp. KSB-10]